MTSTRDRHCARLLELDPELGLRVPPALITRARTEIVVPVQAFDEGIWEVPSDALQAGRFGFLMLEGLLARDVTLAGFTCTELIGEGDLVQPGAGLRDDGLVSYHVHWHVLTPIHVAVLDDAVARRLGEWPQVLGALLERAVRRTLRMSLHQAILRLSPLETRLLVLLWFLAERWGRVTPDGVVVEVQLSHRLLGQLVGCRRASATTGIGHIVESGLLERRPDGRWLLHGAPPEELAQFHWPARAAFPRTVGSSVAGGGRQPARPRAAGAAMARRSSAMPPR